MSVFSLSANANFPDRFGRRVRSPHELSSQPLRATQAEAGREFVATGSGGPGSSGSRIYASRFKANLTNLMSAAPWDGETAPLSGARENENPSLGVEDKEDFLDHLTTLLASASLGEATIARAAAVALDARARGEDDDIASVGSTRAGESGPGAGIDALQSLISAARSGDIEMARAAARHWARDLRAALAADARGRSVGDEVAEVASPGAEAAYQTLMEFTQSDVATAA